MSALCSTRADERGRNNHPIGVFPQRLCPLYTDDQPCELRRGFQVQSHAWPGFDRSATGAPRSASSALIAAAMSCVSWRCRSAGMCAGS